MNISKRTELLENENANNINEDEITEQPSIYNKKIRGIRNILKRSSSLDQKKLRRPKNEIINNQDINVYLRKEEQNEEVSFEITPDEDDLLKSMESNTKNSIITKHNNNNMSSNIDNVNTQTPQKPFTSQIETITQINTSKTNFDYYEEEKPFDALAITKIEKEESTIQTLNSSINPLSLNQNHTVIIGQNAKNKQMGNANLNNKLLQKIKQVKELEQELKDKNALITRLRNQNEKLQNEIKVLNSKTKNGDINQSAKKLKEKEDELIQKKKVMSNLVESYKEKINNLINTNEVSLEKIEELENKLKTYKSKEEEFNKSQESNNRQIKIYETQIKNLNDNLIKMANIREKVEEKNKEYKVVLSHILEYLVNKSKSITEERNKEKMYFQNLIDKLNIFFCEDTDSKINMSNEQREDLNEEDTM